jgi:hypothetical protein
MIEIENGWTKIPHWYIEKLMCFLTTEEFCVLMYVARHIYGWQNKEEDPISLSQFSRGFKDRDGFQYDNGTGLCVNAIQKALNGLMDAKILIKVRSGRSFKDSTIWRLQDNLDNVDEEFLRERLISKRKSSKKRTQKARITREKNINGVEESHHDKVST